MPAVAEIIKRNKEQKNKLVADSRAVIEKAEKENRELGQDEMTKLDQMAADIQSIDKRVETLEKQLAIEDETEDSADEGASDSGDTDPDASHSGEGDRSAGKILILPTGERVRVLGSGEDVDKRRRRADRENRQRPGESREHFETRKRRSRPEYVEAFRAFLLGDHRTLNKLEEKRVVIASVDISGGYMVAPEKMANQIIKAADNYLYLRQLATVVQLPDAQSLGVPTLDTDPADADWTSELATGNEDSAMAFGKRELKPNPLAKRLKVSNTFLRLGQFGTVVSELDESEGGVGSGPERFVTGRLGYKFAVSEEKGMITGNGVNQPLGVFTASTRGISTARDVQTGSSTGYTIDGLLQAKYTLKQPYHNNKLRWLLPRGGVQRILQLKDSFGQYYWQPSVQAGQPDRLLDIPVLMSEYVPATFTTGLYVGMLGNFEYLWIAEAMNIGIQRLNELYAEQNLTGFIARQEFDAMPVLEEAFVRLITN